MESRGNTHAPRHTCRHAWVSLAVFSRARGGMRMTADARTRKTHACASALLCAQPRTYVRVRVRRAYACAYRHTPTQMLHAHSATHARDGPDSRCSMARRTSSSEPSSAPSRAAAAAAGAQRDRRARARARALKCIARECSDGVETPGQAQTVLRGSRTQRGAAGAVTVRAAHGCTVSHSACQPPPNQACAPPVAPPRAPRSCTPQIWNLPWQSVFGRRRPAHDRDRSDGAAVGGGSRSP